jgi:hypothetical protein
MIQIGIHSGAASCASKNFPEIYGNLADEFTIKFVKSVIDNSEPMTKQLTSSHYKYNPICPEITLGKKIDNVYERFL